MPITIFRSHLNEDAADEYYPVAERMSALAQTMPGYMAHKTFKAEDGERVTIVEFADEVSQKNWAQHPEHCEAMKLGRKRFYDDYEIIVCDVKRRSKLG